MIRFLSVLMVAFLVLIQSAPAPAATQVILTPAPNLNPNNTYANAWAAAVLLLTSIHRVVLGAKVSRG